MCIYICFSMYINVGTFLCIYIKCIYIYTCIRIYIYTYIYIHTNITIQILILRICFFAYPPGPKRCGFCASCDRFTQDLKDQIEMILTWVAYETAQPCRLAVELGRETAWDCKTMWHEFPQRRGSFMRTRLLQALCALERDDCVSICFIYDINYQWFFSSRDWSHG